jgi:hypothetical protein
MADKYMLIFNQKNPPRGTKEDETINHALARLRRILLYEIEIIAVSGILIQKNGSVRQDGDLVSVLGSIPILADPGVNILSLHVKAPIGNELEVKTDHILTVSDSVPTIPSGIVLTILPAGEELLVNIFLKTGSVQSTNNIHFNPISTITFYPTESEENNFRFIIELVHGYTEEDFYNFLDQGYKIMENGGGVVTDSSKRSGQDRVKTGKYEISKSDVGEEVKRNEAKFVDSVVGDY